jgi:uncharacterized membrane protein YdjX (TVP38/TMEM64 family)
MAADPNELLPIAPSTWWWRKWVVAAAVVAMVAAGYWLASDRLTLQAVAAEETHLRDLYARQPLVVLGAAAAVYVLATGFSLPIATWLSLVYAWLFGFWTTLVLVSFASTAGASITLLLTRYLLRDAIRPRLERRLAGVHAAIARDGVFYLLLLRLTPLVPYWLVNVAMGLTDMRLLTFWWASQLGMLPGTALIVFTGAQLPSTNVLLEQGAAAVLSWPLVLGLTLLGLFPLLVRRAMPVVAGGRRRLAR